MAIGEPKIDLTLSQDDDHLSYAELTEKLHALVLAKGKGVHLDPDDVAYVCKLFDKYKENRFNHEKMLKRARVEAQMEVARGLFGENFIGPDEIATRWSLAPIAELPAIRFTEEKLQKASECGMFLIYKPTPEQFGLSETLGVSFEAMSQLVTESFDAFSWAENNPNLVPSNMMHSGWVLVSKNVLQLSVGGKNYFQQAACLQDFAVNRLDMGYNEAMNENLAKRLWQNHVMSLPELLFVMMTLGKERLMLSGQEIFKARGYDKSQIHYLGLAMTGNKLFGFDEEKLTNKDELKGSGVMFKWEKFI